MAITGAIVAASTTIGGAVVGNQQKQKAKGDAAQVERDSQAAQAAADAKLQQQHDQTIVKQSQAGAIARQKLSQNLLQPSTILTSGQGAPAAPTERKTLLGQ